MTNRPDKEYELFDEMLDEVRKCSQKADGNGLNRALAEIAFAQEKWLPRSRIVEELRKLKRPETEEHECSDLECPHYPRTSENHQMLRLLASRLGLDIEHEP